MNPFCFLRTSSLLFLILALAACAKPRYASEPANSQVFASKSCLGIDVLCPLAFKGLLACAGLQYEKFPSVGRVASGILYFSKPVPSDTILHARLWMPGHQHFSPRPQLQRLDDSRFAIRRMQFSMIGHWELNVQMIHENKVIDEAILPICL